MLGYVEYQLEFLASDQKFADQYRGSDRKNGCKSRRYEESAEKWQMRDASRSTVSELICEGDRDYSNEAEKDCGADVSLLQSRRNRQEHRARYERSAGNHGNKAFGVGSGHGGEGENPRP